MNSCLSSRMQLHNKFSDKNNTKNHPWLKRQEIFYGMFSFLDKTIGAVFRPCGLEDTIQTVWNRLKRRNACILSRIEVLLNVSDNCQKGDRVVQGVFKCKYLVPFSFFRERKKKFLLIGRPKLVVIKNCQKLSRISVYIKSIGTSQ